MMARSHRPSYLGASVSSAPKKPKPASTAGMAPPIDDDPPAASSKRARSSKSAPDLGSRVLRSTQKSKASGSKSKVPVREDDESAGSSVEIVSAPTGSLGPHAVCVPLDSKREGIRLAKGRPRGHQTTSSTKAVQASNPAPNALTADVLKLLPQPRQLVGFVFLNSCYSSNPLIFSLG
jgi:hypothetical protein